MIYKQIAVRLPRLLDKDLNEVRRLPARTQSIELNITPLSSASLTLEDGSGVAIRSFVELYNAKGSAGIYRVSLPEESYGSGERVSLEHGICTLDDAIIPGQGKISGTPMSVLSSILAHQTTKARGQNLWMLGSVEAPESMNISVEHDGTKTLEMLSKAISELRDYMLTFDQSGFPWVVNVVRKPESAACEGRLSRNVRTIRKTVDDSDLCTRLYCSLLDGGYIESDTVSAWGVVEKSISLNDDMPKGDALAYCQKYLDNRKNPAVAIEMDADEWFAMTGERLDRFEVGDICCLTLPDYGVVIEERIVSMNYMDALGRPEEVTVSLANQIMDMSIKTAEISNDISSLKSTSTSYGNRLSTSETNITNLKDADEGFKEVDNKIVKWFSSAEINLDADETGANVGILVTYQETHDLFDEVGTRVTEAEQILHGGPDGATAGLIARVDENAASIVAVADDVKSRVTIEALEIELKGYVTASRLETEFSNFESGISDTLYVSDLSANDFECDDLTVSGNGISLKRHSHMTGGSVTAGATSTSYSVKDGGVTIGSVIIPSTWRFTPTWGGDIYYLSWE